jgi:hypothetical protein
MLFGSDLDIEVMGRFLRGIDLETGRDGQGRGDLISRDARAGSSHNVPNGDL